MGFCHLQKLPIFSIFCHFEKMLDFERLQQPNHLTHIDFWGISRKILSISFIGTLWFFLGPIVWSQMACKKQDVCRRIRFIDPSPVYFVLYEMVDHLFLCTTIEWLLFLQCTAEHQLPNATTLKKTFPKFRSMLQILILANVYVAYLIITLINSGTNNVQCFKPTNRCLDTFMVNQTFPHLARQVIHKTELFR